MPAGRRSWRERFDGFAGDVAEGGGGGGEGAAGGGEKTGAAGEGPEVGDGAAHPGEGRAVGGAVAGEKAGAVAAGEAVSDGGIVRREEERIRFVGGEEGVHPCLERFDGRATYRLRVVAAPDVDADGARAGEGGGEGVDFDEKGREGAEGGVSFFGRNHLPPGMEEDGAVALGEEGRDFRRTLKDEAARDGQAPGRSEAERLPESGEAEVAAPGGWGVPKTVEGGRFADRDVRAVDRFEEIGEAGVDLTRIADPDHAERAVEPAAQRESRVDGAEAIRESAHRTEDDGAGGGRSGRGAIHVP